MIKEISCAKLALIIGAVVILAALWRAPAIMESAARLWPPEEHKDTASLN